MGWERRPGGYYYYRTRRVNGRMVREYAGSMGSTAGMLAYAQHQREKRERAEKRQAEQAERQRLAAADRALDELYGAVEAVMDAHLVAAGYHQHHGGEWRKRRAQG
jgi:hypothetical protein